MVEAEVEEDDVFGDEEESGWDLLDKVGAEADDLAFAGEEAVEDVEVGFGG